MKTTNHKPQAWLYQMNVREYSPKRFRKDVREGKTVKWWPTRRVRNHGKKQIAEGHHVVFFYTWTAAKRPDLSGVRHPPGLYGIAEVTHVHWEDREFCFKVLPPSDRLKQNPLDSARIRQVQNRIRGGCPMGTMWPIEPKDYTILENEWRHF